MFKVLIVDDEIYVISLIQKLIEWDKFDMSIEGTADNGISALKLVEKLHPDIVIVDVRMPGYDGITFMQKVREINDKVKFIVISGHKRFEYAKSAMQYNVEDYLLKPINKEELEQILSKLRHKLVSEKQHEEVLIQLDERLGVSTKKVHAYLCEDLLEAKEHKKFESLDRLNEMYFTKFREGLFACVILKLDVSDGILDDAFTEELMKRLEGLMKDMIDEIAYEAVSQIRKNEIIRIVNYSQEENKNILKALKTSVAKMNSILAKFEKLSVTIGVGEASEELQHIQNSHKEAEDCIKSRLVLGSGKIITYDMVKRDEGMLLVVFTDKQREKLKEAFKSFNVDMIKLQILETFSRAGDGQYSDTLIYYETAWFVHRMFYEYLCKIDIYKGSYEQLAKEFNERLLWVSAQAQIAGALAEHIKGYIEEYTEDEREGENPAIRIAKKYIAENYQNNISMVSTAEVVNLSPVYFSVLFKKEVGINFLDYLNQYRIEEAKKRLKNVKYNVSEVAAMAGFPDARYFSKIFKKTIGVTPTEYRNRHIE